MSAIMQNFVSAVEAVDHESRLATIEKSLADSQWVGLTAHDLRRGRAKNS